MANQYYYLVASLPELNFELGARNFDHLQLKQQVMEMLQPEDLPLWEVMYFSYDNQNLLNTLLEKEDFQFSPLGKFATREELEEQLNEPTDMPRYMLDFIGYYHDMKEAKNEAALTAIALESKLQTLFYAYAESLSNQFVKKWFSFDRMLRNIQVALLSGKLKKEANDELVGDDELVETLRKNANAVMNLKGEVDGLERLIQLFDNKNIVEKEWKLDETRWEMVDEFTTFDYFTLDKALSFAVKLQIIDRWTTMNKELGERRLKVLLDDIHSTFNLENSVI